MSLEERIEDECWEEVTPRRSYSIATTIMSRYGCVQLLLCSSACIRMKHYSKAAHHPTNEEGTCEWRSVTYQVTWD